MDNTVIIINTDHLNRGKKTCYRQYIPLIIQWNKRIKAGITSDALVSHIDLSRTVARICTVNLPRDTHMDGKSFATMLSEENIPWDNVVYMGETHARGVLTEDWNYVPVCYPENIENALKNNDRKA